MKSKGWGNGSFEVTGHSDGCFDLRWNNQCLFTKYISERRDNDTSEVKGHFDGV